MGNRWWSVLFGVVMFLCGGLFVVAPAVGWWLPRGESAHADSVDFLFYVILYITGGAFILTEALLVIFMFKYASRPEGAPPAERTGFDKAMTKLLSPMTRYLNSPHRVELAWTIVPAAILLYIAFAQVGAWARIKYQSRMPEAGDGSVPQQVAVSARQFEWRMRYPSVQRTEEWLSLKSDAKKEDRENVVADQKSFASKPQFDDIHTVNALHIFGDWYRKDDKSGAWLPATRGESGAVWKADPALIQLSTVDVIHSFNIPQMRVKQDALPGKTIAVWFTPLRPNTAKNEQGRWEDSYNLETKRFGDTALQWDIACAELCGWGHYRMIGRLYVHETQADYLEWLKEAETKEKATAR